MPKKLTQEQFESKIPSHITLLSKYNGTKKDITIRCGRCDNVNTTKANILITKYKEGCGYCHKRISISDLEFRIRIYPSLILVSYDILKKEVTTKCCTCNSIETNHPTRFKRSKHNSNKTGCKICNKDEYKNSIKGRYIGDKNPNYGAEYVKFNCNQCGVLTSKRKSESSNSKFCNIKCKSQYQKTDNKLLNKLRKMSKKGAKASAEKHKDPEFSKAVCKKTLETKIRNGTLTNHFFQSKIANEFIESLLKFLPERHTYYYGDNETFLRDGSVLAFYDFEVRELKKIIEFNGDYYHANPLTYKKSDIIRGKSAKSIWQRDKVKKNLAISKGYDIKYIWESDYNKDKESVIKECVGFIMGNR